MKTAWSSPWAALASRRRFLPLALRLFLGAVFLYAGFLKARDPADFVSDLRGYRLFPEATIFPLAAYVPFLEMLVGAALVSGFFYSGALILAGGLLFAFNAVILSAISRGIDISCGCFGHHGISVSLRTEFLRNCVLCVFLGALFWSFAQKRRRPL